MSTNTILVGVDGSAASRAALEWAVEEARLRNARLHVVHTWTLPVSAYAAPVGAVLDGEVLDGVRDAAEQLVSAVLDDVDAGGVEVDRSVVEGSPAASLLEAAENADLLVVGSRGRGGFAGLLLGSVSQQCAQHAPCPVVIVRAPAAG
jgi:nucleotide-binding universal stress UspA family protein